MGKRFSLRNSNYLLEFKVEKSYGSYKKNREEEHFTTHFESVSLEQIAVYSS